MADHVVKQGECSASIAKEHGFRTWETIWDHPANAALREQRRDPYVLYPDDVVVVPEKRQKDVAAATERTHVYRVKTLKTRLRVRMLHNGRPLAGEPFELEVGGRKTLGSTDGDGKIDVEIPADALTGRLLLVRRGEEYPLGLGHLDPVDTITGAQARLGQLGLYAGRVDGDMGDYTRDALRSFQRRSSLSPTSELDAPTQDALRRAYGC
jgi:hypothetical protein